MARLHTKSNSSPARVVSSTSHHGSSEASHPQNARHSVRYESSEFTPTSSAC